MSFWNFLGGWALFNAVRKLFSGSDRQPTVRLRGTDSSSNKPMEPYYLHEDAIDRYNADDHDDEDYLDRTDNDYHLLSGLYDDDRDFGRDHDYDFGSSFHDYSDFDHFDYDHYDDW